MKYFATIKLPNGKTKEVTGKKAYKLHIEHYSKTFDMLIIPDKSFDLLKEYYSNRLEFDKIEVQKNAIDINENTLKEFENDFIENQIIKTKERISNYSEKDTDSKVANEQYLKWLEQKEASLKKWKTVSEFAAMCNVTRQTIYNDIKKGMILINKIAGYSYINTERYDWYIKLRMGKIK